MTSLQDLLVGYVPFGPRAHSRSLRGPALYPTSEEVGFAAFSITFPLNLSF
ncbi:MAG: hypothetical protein ICV55_06630 [Coleofasciculus sp. C3-bin4]|nr:hypothetical protein [Coleofasciculus sp. C3-bin4]